MPRAPRRQARPTLDGRQTMLYLDHADRLVLRALRDCQLHTPYELAAQLDFPPYRVRGSLSALRRQGLVRRSQVNCWDITDSGLSQSYTLDQLKLA